MGVFDVFRKDSSDKKPQIRIDNVDDNPRRSYDDLGWKHESDIQDYEELTNQFKHDAIARRVVAKPAEDATRNGWRLVIPDNPDKQEQYQAELDRLKLQDVLSKQMIYQRMHGDGYITYGVQETAPTDTRTPLDPDNIENIAFIHAFGQNHVEKYQSNDDPTSMDYGKEQAVVIRPTQGSYSIDENGLSQETDPPKLKPVIIDRSRYAHISLDKFEDDMTGTSIIERCKEQIKALDIALKTNGKILREFSFKLVQSDSLMSEEQDKYEADKWALSQAFNTGATAFMGSEDNIQKLSTPTNNINVLFDFAWQALAAASNIPKSVLTGEQAGTLAGASQDVANYYDSVKAMQEQLLKPELEYIVKLLMWSKGVAGGYDDPDSLNWHIEFNPLWSPDDKTQSETLVNHANAASTLVSSGIYDMDEAKQLFDGQGNNNISGMQNLATKTDSAEDVLPEPVATQYEKDKKEVNKHGEKHLS